MGRNLFFVLYLDSLYERKFKRPSPNETIDIQWLIHAFGTFTIPRLYYEAFEFLGSFIAGMDGILYQWAQFTVRASGEKLGMEDALRFLLSTPTTERDVLEAKNHYDRILASEGKLKCVWTGRPIRDLNIDHIIPFTVWKNNQLWNLLPTSAEINRQKSDRIPSSQILLERKDPILNYWELMAGSIPERFFKEIHYSLLGEGTVNNWQERAFHKLSENCQYLIDVRGFEPWPS